jgi:cytoskeletal protein CcmA (bactofilin family)
MQDDIIQEEKTSISNSTTIVGDIKAKEHLIINGTITGSIEIQDYNLFIGPSGKVEGDVQARSVRIRGHMNGRIEATDKVEITSEAYFSGNIKSKSISVEKGAWFDALVNLGSKPPKT